MEAIVIFFVIMSIMWGMSWLLEQMKGQQQAGQPGQKRETPLQNMLRMIEEAQEKAAEQQRPQQRPPQRPQQRRRPPRAQPVPRARPADEHGGKLAQRHLDSKIDQRQVGTLGQRRLKSKVDRRPRHLQHDVHTAGAHGAPITLGFAAGDARRRRALERHSTGERLTNRLARLSPLQQAVILKEILDTPRSVRWRSRRKA